MKSLEPDRSLDVIVTGAGCAFSASVIAGLVSCRLTGQGAAQATARNHGI